MTTSIVRTGVSRAQQTSRITLDIRNAEATASELAARLSSLTHALTDLAAQIDAPPEDVTLRSAAIMLTPEEAAESLRVSRTVIFSLIKVGTLRSVKIGNSRRIPAAALTDYVATLNQ